MINIRDLKDKAILCGWIAGLLIFISLLWILTQPVQARYLLRTVNAVFMSEDDARRVSAYTGYSGRKAGLFGYWYSMYNSTDSMFVFAVFKDGILIPLGAITTNEGSVSEIIPLSEHAMQVMDNLPKSILQMYASRIEAEAVENLKGKSK